MANFSSLGVNFSIPACRDQDRLQRLQNAGYSRNFRTRLTIHATLSLSLQSFKRGMAWTSMSESVHKYK